MRAEAQKLTKSQPGKVEPIIDIKGKKIQEFTEFDQEGSEDEGLKIGDMIQSRSDVLHNEEPNKETSECSENDRMLWAMQCDINHLVVINEYGSNLFKSKV